MNMIWIWLIIIVITVIAEVVTVGLTCIWLTGGALVSLVISALSGPIWLQIAAFFAVTFVLLYFTRPWAVKYLNKKKIRTNVDAIVGSRVRIVEEVDNHNGTGKAILNGMEWTARALDSTDVFAPDEEAEVARVEGVKILLKKLS